MREIEVSAKAEQRLLRRSVTLLVCLSCVSFGFGLLTGSFAILFDGFYALIDAGMSGLSLLVSRLITEDALRRDTGQPGKVRYQYGFWHFEPLVLSLNAIMLTVVVLYALAGALVQLFDGGSVPDFGWAIVYAGGMTVICLGMGIMQGRANRTVDSALVALDAKSWKMSGAISFALFIAFIIGWLLTGTRYEHLQPFVDPAIVSLVCLAVLPAPLSDLRNAIREVFRIAPEDLDAHVTAVAAKVVKTHGLEDAYTYVSRVGRSLLIEIQFLAPKGWPVTSVAQLDAIREEVGQMIGEEGPHRWLTISFTEDPDWAF
jgi:predicted Co/Zn/Cd cation transporter (cation efflux family)